MSLTDIANIAKELLPPVRGFIRWLWGGLQWLYRHLLRSKRAKFYGLRDDIRSVRVRTGTLLTALSDWPPLKTAIRARLLAYGKRDAR